MDLPKIVDELSEFVCCFNSITERNTRKSPFSSSDLDFFEKAILDRIFGMLSISHDYRMLSISLLYKQYFDPLDGF